jgi:hypothetical protein
MTPTPESSLLPVLVFPSDAADADADVVGRFEAFVFEPERLAPLPLKSEKDIEFFLFVLVDAIVAAVVDAR